MQYAVGLNLKPFLPFSLFECFPSSESFQRCLLIHLHLNREGSREPLVSVMLNTSHKGGLSALAVPGIVAGFPLPPTAGSSGHTHSFINPFHSLLICSYPLQHGEKIAIPRRNKKFIRFGNQSCSIEIICSL